MSPQKKPAAKPVTKKVSKKVSEIISKKTTRKAIPKRLKKTANKLSPPGPLQSLTNDMLDTFGIGVYLAQQGKYVAASPIFEKLTGYAAADLVGKRILDHVHPDDRQTVQSGHKKQGGNPYEYRFIKKNGEVLRVLETSGPVVHQKAKAMLGSIMDVTRLKQPEESIGFKEGRYSTILQEIAENYYEDDLKGNFTFVNDALVGHIGYPKEELLGMNYRQYCDAATAEKMRELYARVYQTGKPFSGFEAQFTTKDGSKRFAEVSGSLIRDKEGKPLGFRGLFRDITERKRIEDDLRKSEERYRTILEEIEDGYGELDLAGNWTFINEAGANNIGYTPDELVGKNYREVTEEASVQKVFELFNNVYKTGHPFKNEEVEFISKQGNRRVNEISGALVRDEKGQPIGFRGLSRDVTERKWAEDALLQSEAKYFSIIESIGEAYFETDITGIFTFINDKVCKDLGYTREELLHMNNRSLQDEDSARETYAIFNEVYEIGFPVKAFQFKAIRKDGREAFFEMSISLMKDAKGKPIGFRGLSRDITERKKMEDALKASEERARTIIATIPDPYMESDLKGQITYVNAAYVLLTGYTLDELKTIDYKKYLDKKNSNAIFVLYNTVYKTGLPMKNVELEFTTKNGENKLVNISVSLIRDPQGNPTGFHGIVRDITEKKKAEELIRQSEQSLREYSETLELRVRERTVELEKAKFAAEAASRTKSDFLANISHEFQTPLNAIIGFTKVLQDRMFGELNGKQEEFIRYIADAGASLSKIITEILDMTHVASGSIKLNLSSVSIVNALSKTTRLLTPQMEEKKQVLTVDVALDADISIEADEQKIQQVFFHLLSNAVKYNTEGGKVHIQALKTSHKISGQEGISIAITDTGTGIKAEDIPKLFQTFGTLESPYTRSEKGIGIGLSLTKQLVELHGGTIRVESEFGRGSCFTIFLPLTQRQTGSME